MTAPFLSKRTQIAIKAEATAGTAIALAAADVSLHTGEAEWDPDIEMVPRAAMSASLSSRGSVAGTKAGKISWKQFLRGTAVAPVTASNETDFNTAMEGCGALGTVSGAPTAEQTSWIPNTGHTLDDTSGVYCTVALYQDGKIYKIHGAVGNCVLTFTTGMPVEAAFEFTGIWNTPIDGALLAPTYPVTIEPPFLDAAFSVLGYAAAKIKSFTLDFGNEIVMRPDPNNTTGFFTAQIVGRNSVGTLDPEEALVSVKDWYAAWVAGTTGAITTGVFPSGGTNYNQLQCTIAKAKYLKVGKGNRDGIATAPIDYECVATLDAGDDDFEFIQT